LLTDIGELWLIAIRTSHGSLQIITENGSRHSAVKVEHGVETVCEVGWLLCKYHMAKDKAGEE
jgi:hypothetical protein